MIAQFRIVAAALVAGLAAGCVTPTEMYPLAEPVPLLEAPTTVATARSGDVLTHQIIRPANRLTLETTAKPTGNITIGPDVVLSAVRIMDPKGPPLVCTPAGPGARFKIRNCFEYKEIGGVLYAVGHRQMLLMNSGGSFSKGVLELGDGRKIDPPIPLRPSNATAEELEVGIRFVSDSVGARLERVLVSGLFATPVKNASMPIPTSLPATISIGGFRIELVGLSDGELTYRIIAGLPASPPIVVDLAG